ncbi:MAG: trypsin-like serine protease, partial [Rhodobacteraceae bacterium]|nr:trypsin-like serine protease [Paracoccaceae bacterium]
MILMGALSAAPVAAQMASPDRPVQRSTMSAADLEQIAATARPRQPTRMIEPAAATATAMVAPAESGEAPRVTAGHAGVPVRTMVDEREYRAMVAAAESARDGAVSTQAEGISTQNYGLNFQDTLYHYSDRLVSPRPYYAPERSTGLLLFQASDSNWYICTATLIQRAIILTAGHCVYEGGTGDDTGWNLQGYFIPAYSASDGS